jgi:hypothetical protein
LTIWGEEEMELGVSNKGEKGKGKGRGKGHLKDAHFLNVKRTNIDRDRNNAIDELPEVSK